VNARDYNEARLKIGWITPDHVTELVRRFQAANELDADGMAGPKTIALLELLAGRTAGDVKLTVVTSPRSAARVEAPQLARLEVDSNGWLVGDGVTRIATHPSRYYPRLSTDGSEPRAIVAHYTATAHGTAVNMAKRLAVKMSKDDRAASWHVSIEGDGSIIQQAPFKVGCWHAGGPTAKPIPGLGSANRTSVGIELVGDGSAFPEPQVIAACRVWAALVAAYRIPRDRAMVTHQELDPTRKRDPGALWMKTYAPRVLSAAGL
jgi:hypothetical protein